MLWDDQQEVTNARRSIMKLARRCGTGCAWIIGAWIVGSLLVLAVTAASTAVAAVLG